MKPALRSILMILCLSLFQGPGGWAQEGGLRNDSGTLGEAVLEEAPAPTIWDIFPPQIYISPWGEQLKIEVSLHPNMPADKKLTVEEIKLEKLDGEFLGLMGGYAPDQTDRRGKFLLDLKVLEIEEARVSIQSSTDGLWTRVILLETSGNEPPPQAAPSQASAAKEKPKRKAWLW